MSVKTNWNNILDDAANIAAAGEDASPIGLEFLDNLLYPNLQQRKEFGQQVALQEMLNDWSVSGRFEAMKDVGINANVAAGGIAGNGSPVTSSTNSSVGAGAQGLGAAAQAAGALNDAVNAGVNVYEKISLTPSKVDETKANVRNLLSAALHNDWLAYAVSEMLPLQKDNQRADTWLKLANFSKAREEKKLINKRIDEAVAHIDELKAQADLYKQQGDLVLFQQTKTLYDTEQIALDNNKKQWDKDWRDRFKYDPNAPVDVALEQAMVNDAGDNVVNAIGDSVKQVAYGERKGFNEAEIEDAFDKAFNEVLGKTSVDAEYAEFFADIEAWKEIFVDMWKNANENPSNIGAVISKALNQIVTILSNYQVTYNKNNPISKPNVVPRRR